MRAIGLRLIMMSLLAALFVGCVTDEIVVVTLEGGPPAEMGRPHKEQQPCDKSSDCPHSNDICNKFHCYDEHGLCEPWPTVCDTMLDPRCGCDGVTYWNDCLRKQAGVVSSSMHECGVNAASCSTGADCPIAGGSCAHLLPPGAMCSGNALGACWMVPPVCPTPFGPVGWTSCDDPMRCEGLCSAIRSGASYRQSPPPGCAPDRDY